MCTHYISGDPFKPTKTDPVNTELNIISSYQAGHCGGHEGKINIRFPHLCAMNSDIVGLMTLKCLPQPVGCRKHECYGKSTSCASEKTEILTLESLYMILCLVIGSAGSSGLAFETCQFKSLSPAKIKSV